jgi:hypothetical protein
MSWAGFKLTTLVVTDSDCIGRCKSNYHLIMSMMATINTRAGLTKWATFSSWFQWNRPISVNKRSFSRPVSLFKSIFFSPRNVKIMIDFQKSPRFSLTSPLCQLREKSSRPVFTMCGEPCKRSNLQVLKPWIQMSMNISFSANMRKWTLTKMNETTVL